MYRRAPVGKFKIHIYEAMTNKEIELRLSLLRPQTNNFSTGRIEIYRFAAPEGDYNITFTKRTNILKAEKLISDVAEELVSKITILTSTETSKFSIEIRKSQPQIITFLAIPMLLIGLFSAVGGLVLGLLAEQIIK